MKALVILHVGAGGLALVSGLVAFIARKGRPLHNRAGQVFAASMAVVCVTMVPMSLMAGNLFLFSIGVFSAYMAYSGVRSIYRNRARRFERLSALDLGVLGVTALTALGMLGGGAVAMARGSTGTGIVLLVFGAACAWMCVEDLRIHTGRHHVQAIDHHLGRMGGAMIAATTAFLVQNVGGDTSLGLALLIWLGPSAVGTTALVWMGRRRRRVR